MHTSHLILPCLLVFSNGVDAHFSVAEPLGRTVATQAPHQRDGVASDDLGKVETVEAFQDHVVDFHRVAGGKRRPVEARCNTCTVLVIFAI